MRGRTITAATGEQTYTVGDVTTLAGVSIRTLHHYDAIGLLSPSERTVSGYRLYRHDDLEQLQQILVYRELDFPLDAIGRLLLDPAFDRRSALAAQRAQLAGRVRRMETILGAIDRALDALEKGTTMSESEMFEVFGDFDPTTYEDEVRERWGETDAYAESARRTARYSKDDWKAIKAEGEAVTLGFAERLAAGADPAEPEVLALVDRHREQINRWFYPCSIETQAQLGEMYVADPRFAAAYDRVRPGLAVFVRDAIRARAARAPD